MSIGIVDGDVLKWTPVWALGQHAYMPSIHAIQDSHTALGVTQAEVLAQIEGALGTNPQGIVVAGITYHGHSIQTIFPLPISIPEVNVTSAGAGTAAGQTSPPQCAPIAKFRAAIGGKPYQGRFYFPPVPASFLTIVDPIILLNIDAAKYATIMNDVLSQTTITGAGGTASLRWVLFHRTTLPKYGILANSVSGIVTVAIDARVGTQRRRSSFKHGGIPPF